VGELQGLDLQVAVPGERGEFWSPWTDVTYIPSQAEDAAVEGAFETLIAATDSAAQVSPERQLDYVLALDSQARRREIAHQERRSIHGTEWTVLELWDRVSHLSPSRVAFTVHDGDLLVLTIDRGVFERTGPAFAALLASFEVNSRQGT
jgi:hypothetical protein